MKLSEVPLYTPPQLRKSTVVDPVVDPVQSSSSEQSTSTKVEQLSDSVKENEVTGGRPKVKATKTFRKILVTTQ